MASYSYGLAKGLREPCSPYREAYYFGAELNVPSADGWNCLPELVGQTQNFDLSTIPEGREVLVALLKVSNTPEGTLDFRAQWFRNRDNKILFTQDWSCTARAGGQVYFYTYLGRVSWEINENGGYRVEFFIKGQLGYFKVIPFEISGIPPEMVVEPIPTGAIGWISERFSAASGFFYLAYLEILDWMYPFWMLSEPFYELSGLCADLSWDFYDFAIWVRTITDRIQDVFSWDIVWSYILTVVPNLEDLRDWFYNWWPNVYGVVAEWWAATSWTVRAWIDQAAGNTMTFINQVETSLADLRDAWDTFRTITWPGMLSDLAGVRTAWEDFISGILPNLATWTGVGELVESTLRSWFPFYDDLAALWGGIREFFTDPEDWLYKSIDRIIERFW